MTGRDRDPPPAWTCPYCGAVFTATTDIVACLCPSCGRQVVVGPADASEPQDTPPVTQIASDDELDGLRVRQIAVMKRSAWRSRSYMLIVLVGLLTIAGQMIWMAIQQFRRGDAALISYLYLAVAGGCLALTRPIWLRAQRLKAEAQRSDLPAPTGPPDFSSLSDGSQRWKNLERIHDAGEAQRD